MAEMTVIEAVRDAMRLEMRRDSGIFVLGEDVGSRGGVFLATDGLWNVVPADVELHIVEGDESHGYFYTEDRLWFVDLETREVVYSPGTVVAAEVEVN